MIHIESQSVDIYIFSNYSIDCILILSSYCWTLFVSQSIILFLPHDDWRTDASSTFAAMWLTEKHTEAVGLISLVKLVQGEKIVTRNYTKYLSKSLIFLSVAMSSRKTFSNTNPLHGNIA